MRPDPSGLFKEGGIHTAPTNVHHKLKPETKFNFLFYYHNVVVFFALLEEEVLVVEQGSSGDGRLRVGEFLFVH